MRKTNNKDRLPFPIIQDPINKKPIDKKDLLKEFFPKIYWKEEIEKLEAELNNKSLSTYTIAVKKLYLESCRNEFEERLKNEAKKYKEKNREAIETSEIKAQKGDNLALFSLIRWDKEWLFKDWVKKKIIIAEKFGNRDFLNSLAKAITVIRKKCPQDQLVNFLKRLKVAGYNFSDKKKIEDLRIFLFNYFNDMTVSDGGDAKRKYIIDKNHSIFKTLISSECFNKLLIRKRIRGNKRFRK